MSKQQKIDHLLVSLEAAGKRATPQRYAVCQALVEHGGHPTVAEIFERVRATFPMISQATVYNTVDTLRELGLVWPLEISTDEHTHYDLDPQAHVNVVCTRCGTIVDTHALALDALLAEVGTQTGYTLVPANTLVVYGLCVECQKARQRAEFEL